MDAWLLEDSDVGVRRDLSFSNWCYDDVRSACSGRLSMDSSSSGTDSEVTLQHPQPVAPWLDATEDETQVSNAVLVAPD